MDKKTEEKNLDIEEGTAALERRTGKEGKEKREHRPKNDDKDAVEEVRMPNEEGECRREGTKETKRLKAETGDDTKIIWEEGFKLGNKGTTIATIKKGD